MLLLIHYQIAITERISFFRVTNAVSTTVYMQSRLGCAKMHQGIATQSYLFSPTAVVDVRLVIWQAVTVMITAQ